MYFVGLKSGISTLRCFCALLTAVATAAVAGRFAVLFFVFWVACSSKLGLVESNEKARRLLRRQKKLLGLHTHHENAGVLVVQCRSQTMV